MVVRWVALSVDEMVEMDKMREALMAASMGDQSASRRVEQWDVWTVEEMVARLVDHSAAKMAASMV